MSETPPPLSRWPAYVSWSIILIIVIGLPVFAAIRSVDRSNGRTRRAVRVQLTILAKTAIGARSLKPEIGQVLIERIYAMAQLPEEKLSIVIIAGEFQGKNAALQRLDRLAAEPHPSALNEDITCLRTLYIDGPLSLDTNCRNRLRQDQGYLGEVALTFQQSDSDPLRQSVLNEAKHAFWILVGIEVLAFGLLLVGLVLLIVGIALRVGGTLRSAYVPQPADGTVYLEMFAVYLLSYVLLSLLILFILGSASSLVLVWILSALLPPIIAIAWAAWRGKSWAQLRNALGWHGGRGWFVEIPLGIVGYLAGLPLLAIGFAMTAYLLRFAKGVPVHPLVGEPTRSFLEIAQLLAIASIGAPIVEETMFRGALFHHMRQRWGWMISASVVAVIFAAIHPTGWATIPALGSTAIVLAGLREWRGSIFASMTAHALHNGLIIGILILLK